jgi:hypothetical protein
MSSVNNTRCERVAGRKVRLLLMERSNPTANCFASVEGITLKTSNQARCQWLTPVILAMQEAEIRRIMVQSQPRQIVHETLSQKNPSQKRAVGVAQGEGPEFKPQFYKTNKQKPKVEYKHISQ